MKKEFPKIFLVLSILVILAIATPAISQTAENELDEESVQSLIDKQIEQLQKLISPEILAEKAISINTSPLTPGPNEDVRVNLNSYSINLNTSFVSWSFNGIVRKSGRGTVDFSFNSGTIGQVNRIKASITTAEGTVVTKEVIVQPAGVELLWETNGYVPPFYKGKALNAYQGEIRVVALPDLIENGTRFSPNALIYKWSKDGTLLGSQSGRGKSTLTIEGSLLIRPITVSVEVSTPDEAIKAKKNLVVQTVRPRVLIYENNPFNGVRYEQAFMGEFLMKEKEVNLVVVPYFFSPEEKETNTLVHTWRMNGKVFDTGEDKNTVTLKQPDMSGFSNINIEVESKNKILQSARSGVVMRFEGDTSGKRESGQ
ncbi:MAG: hypothetical protein KAR00_03600 [Candidatus Pacebacteria bacterium]|nr:hypothetical protein [Candidatus Paceibacterota bacterium]